MRREILWYLIAVAWLIDSVLAFHRQNSRPAILSLFFACCFFATGLYMQRKHPPRR
jgi:hypothetical protein